jgi:hypothetical protein
MRSDKPAQSKKSNIQKSPKRVSFAANESQTIIEETNIDINTEETRKETTKSLVVAADKPVNDVQVSEQQTEIKRVPSIKETSNTQSSDDQSGDDASRITRE